MRQVGNIQRKKESFNLTDEEFRSGEWIKKIPKADKFEVLYKNGFLIIKNRLKIP